MTEKRWPKTLCLVCGELLDHHRMCACTRGLGTPKHVEVVPANEHPQVGGEAGEQLYEAWNRLWVDNGAEPRPYSQMAAEDPREACMWDDLAARQPIPALSQEQRDRLNEIAFWAVQYDMDPSIPRDLRDLATEGGGS